MSSVSPISPQVPPPLGLQQQHLIPEIDSAGQRIFDRDKQGLIVEVNKLGKRDRDSCITWLVSYSGSIGGAVITGFAGIPGWTSGHSISMGCVCQSNFGEYSR